MRVPRIDRARLIQGSTSPSQRCGRPVATQPQPTRVPTCAARRFLSVLLLAACLLLLPPVIRSSATARCSAFRALAHSSLLGVLLPTKQAKLICPCCLLLTAFVGAGPGCRPHSTEPRSGRVDRRLGSGRGVGARWAVGVQLLALVLALPPARNRSAQQQPPTTRPQLRIRVPPHPTGTTRSGGAAQAGQTGGRARGRRLPSEIHPGQPASLS